MTNKPTQRFNAYREWFFDESAPNLFFFGFVNMLSQLRDYLQPGSKMIEIGSYMGESTMLFASTQLFSEINVIEPFEGDEEFNRLFNYDWDYIRKQYNYNTRYHSDIINLYEGYSYSHVNKFKKHSMDFIYIDGSHEEKNIRRDIQQYLTILKPGGILGGHDYTGAWPGVIRAVTEEVGTPDYVFEDTSWFKIIY